MFDEDMEKNPFTEEPLVSDLDGDAIGEEELPHLKYVRNAYQRA